MWRFLNLVLYFCIRKSYPNKQSDADHGNWNGCQLVTQKQGIFQENEEKNADFYVIKHISHKHFVSLQR